MIFESFDCMVDIEQIDRQLGFLILNLIVFVKINNTIAKLVSNLFRCILRIGNEHDQDILGIFQAFQRIVILSTFNFQISSSCFELFYLTFDRINIVIGARLR